MILRKAERRDLPELREIYNYEVENTTVTFDLYPKDMAYWEALYEAHREEKYPFLVAEVDGRAAGYATLSRYRERPAYDRTVELSVYVHRDYRRRGIARALMERLLELARANEDVHLVVSVITGDNLMSVEMHEKLGFRFVGELRESGYKFGHYIGSLFYEVLV